MKIIATITSLLVAVFTLNFTNKTSKTMSATSSIYDIEINSISGEPINLGDFRGKKILIVNTASECGFTGQ